MGSVKRDVRPPAEPKADPWSRAPGEEVPLIEAQDPSLIDQQEGPVVTPVSAPDPSPKP